MLLKCCSQYATHLENSPVASKLEKVSFHSNSKERHCQRMFKLPYNCAYLTCEQGNAQYPLNKVSTIHELRTSRCTTCVQKRQRKQIKFQTSIWSQKRQRNSRKTIYSVSQTKLTPLTVWFITNYGKLLNRWE